jgi:DNA-binding response OmpR family regulator
MMLLSPLSDHSDLADFGCGECGEEADGEGNGDGCGSARCTRVLIVEDDRPSRVALGVLCCQLGLDAVAAASLGEAMALLTGEGPAPDRVVLDLLLPDGDGLDVLRHVRARWPRTKVAVVTGVDSVPLLRAVRRLKPDLLLRKPLDWDKLGGWLVGP